MNVGMENAPEAPPRQPQQTAGANGPQASSPVQSGYLGSLWSKYKSALLTLASFALTALVISNAYYQRQQFYPSVVYITKSNPSMAVIYAQAFVFVILLAKLMRTVFFGRLRAAEFEHLIERSWYAVTETCLAFTVFKDDFSPKFVALFTVLLFLKSFHWLAEDRVDFMERSPSINLIFHVRVLALATLLAGLDIYFIHHAVDSTISKGPSVQLVFGFEYAILLTIVGNTVVKYVLHSIDLNAENPWDNKAVFMLYTELVVGLIKVVLYVVFITIMIRIYTLPLFAVRPMYLTMRAFKKAFNDVILSRKAIHIMNTYYPDATAEELANTDNVCIICREEMTAASNTKRLPCGHIFHKNCLRAWFQRQQTCPTCRLDVLRAPLPGSDAARQRDQAQRQRGQQQGGNQQPGGGAPPFNQDFIAQFLRNMQQQQQQQARARSGASTAGSSSTTTTTSTASTSASMPSPPPSFMFPPGMMPPPPMFGFPPFSVPPPMPPANFSGLTPAELEAMEGRERENVEARIRCLRNIQVLLDAAVMEMQQYSNVVSRINTTRPAAAAAAASTSTTSATTTAPTPSTTAASSSTAGAAASGVTTAATTSASVAPSASTGAIPKNSSPRKEEAVEKDMADILSKMDEKVEEKKEEEKATKIEEAPTGDKENDDDKTSSKEDDEMRRMRLARFESQQSNNK